MSEHQTSSTAPRTVDAPGATLTYDVHPAGSAVGGGGRRPLVLVGSPMDASGFTALAEQVTDRTVVTLDPRGTGRSVRSDGAAQSNPREHAGDLAQVIEALGGGPVDVFASSGGAINALQLVSGQPELIHTLVAHEPPLAQVLPDRAEVVRACQVVHDRYQQEGQAAGMAAFMALTMTEGPLPEGFAAQLGQSPVDAAAMGLPTEDDGSRDDPLLGQNMTTCSPHELDLDSLRAAATRIVVAAGEESGQQMAARAAGALAAELGTEAVMFPSHHAGFTPQEWGMGSEPEPFGKRLLEVLDRP